MPVRQDKKGRWHAEACHNRKRLHRKLDPGATESDAKLVAAELLRALHQQAKAAPTAKRTIEIPGDPPLAELMADYVSRHAPNLRSPDTAIHHANRIGPWLAGRRASETRQVAAKIVQDMTGHYAPATINRSLGALKKALRDAWQRGSINQDLSGLIRRLPENNARTTYLTVAQVRKLANHASENVRAAIWIALLTGCRRGEVCKIQAEDIGADMIRLPAGNTKTLRYRQVPIVPALRPWLKYLPLAINFEGLKSGFGRARVAAGMPNVHFHDLRHSCATLMLQLGTPLHVVRDILGHTSVKTTERYAHAMTAPQHEALSRLGDYTQALHPVKSEPATGSVSR
jgi:integrase